MAFYFVKDLIVNSFVRKLFVGQVRTCLSERQEKGRRSWSLNFFLVNEIVCTLPQCIGDFLNQFSR